MKTLGVRMDEPPRPVTGRWGPGTPQLHAASRQGWQRRLRRGWCAPLDVTFWKLIRCLTALNRPLPFLHLNPAPQDRGQR